MDPARTTATTDAQNAAKATACNAFFCLSSSEKSGDLKKNSTILSNNDTTFKNLMSKDGSYY